RTSAGRFAQDRAIRRDRAAGRSRIRARFLSSDDGGAFQQRLVDCDCDDHRSSSAKGSVQCSRHGCDDELDAAFAKNHFAIAGEPKCSAKNEIDSAATGEERTRAPLVILSAAKDLAKTGCISE